MRSYSIGREKGCDIVINDSTDVISRRHAVLTVGPGSKMTIMDQSQNGTYINGIRISRNVPVPVTRKDNVSFAHVAQMDWNAIPNPTGYQKYVIAAIAAVIVIGGGVWAYMAFSDSPAPTPAEAPAPAPAPNPENTLNKDKETEKETPDAEKQEAEKQNAEKEAEKQKTEQEANTKHGKTGTEKDNTRKSDEKEKDTKTEETPSNASKYRL